MGSVKIIEHFTHSYGDLIYDLCHSMLGTPSKAQSAFRRILKKVLSQRTMLKSRLRGTYSSFERAWVLRVACEHLLKISAVSNGTSKPNSLDSPNSPDSSNPLDNFKSFFEQLLPEDRLLLLLKDKYGLQYQEVSTCMNIAIGALKIRRQQALGALEEWIFL